MTTSRGANSYGYSTTSGQLTSITTFDGVGVTYGYDGSLIKDISWSGPTSGNVHKTYDSSFRLSSESVGGQTINLGYDSDDLLTAAGAMTIARDPATGFVTGTSLGAVTDSHSYDAYGAEQTYTVTANGATLYSVNYGTRDTMGRIVRKTEIITGVSHAYDYTYDVNGRLTDVSMDGSATSHYGYNANGNRTVGPRLTASPVYDDQDRLLSYADCAYSYRPDGSLQMKTCLDGTAAYDYDAFGNLRGVTLANGTAITYLIDGQNRRVGKKVNGTLVESFLYRSQLQPAEWLNGDGSVKATFVYGLLPNVPEYMVMSGTTYRLLTDQVGSVRLVADAATGVVAERIDWDEFGNVISDSAPGFQPFGFEGGLRDLHSGLTRFGTRDYDPTTGRWTTSDPLRFGARDPNFYAFVGGDPINASDPTGLSKLVFSSGLGILVVLDDNGNWITSYPAHNVTINPTGDPNLKDSYGPAPRGTFPVQYPITQGNDRYGPYFFPIGERGPHGEPLDIARIRGIGIHGGRRSRWPNNPTQGCIRMNDPDLDNLYLFYQFDPITEITVQ